MHRPKLLAAANCVHNKKLEIPAVTRVKNSPLQKNTQPSDEKKKDENQHKSVRLAERKRRVYPLGSPPRANDIVMRLRGRSWPRLNVPLIYIYICMYVLLELCVCVRSYSSRSDVRGHICAALPSAVLNSLEILASFALYVYSLENSGILRVYLQNLHIKTWSISKKKIILRIENLAFEYLKTDRF